MPRVNVWLSEELAETVRAALPDVNFSKVLADGLRALMRCDHRELACAACGHREARHEIEDVMLGRFYRDLMWELDQLVRRLGTAEGAARIAKSVGARYRVSATSRLPIPRPTRGERHAYKVREFPLERRA